MHEAFDVTSGQVAWRDDQGLVRMVYDRRSGVLQMHESNTDDPAATVRLDADGITRLAQQIQSLSMDMERQAATGSPAQQALARQRWQQLLQARGPWPDMDRVRAEDPRPLLNGSATVLTYTCSRIALQAGGERVGEACVAPAQALEGGPAVLQMLQAMAAVLDQLRDLSTDSVPLAWPSHPLVAAARSGLLPLRVIQQAPRDSVRHSLELASVAPLARTPASQP